MDTYTPQQEEEAFIDFMAVRQAALEAAVGHMVTLNLPTLHLRIIRDTATDDLLRFAAQIALHARGENWRASE